jgi:hypothetical protein
VAEVCPDLEKANGWAAERQVHSKSACVPYVNVNACVLRACPIEEYRVTIRGFSVSLMLVSFFLGPVLNEATAQVVRKHDIALRNWSAPRYWQPSQAQASSLTTSPMVFVAMSPCRVVDTRASQGFPGPFGPPSLSPGPVRNFPIQSSTKCTIPAEAEAYSFNVTVVPPGSLGYLIMWPQGQTQPNIVTLDDITGDIRNNAAIVPAGTPNGGVSAVVNGNTDLVIDINGYYAPVNMSGSGHNVAVGFDALPNNNGYDNTALGYNALFNNTSGELNAAIGSQALYSNTTGSDNTAIGDMALFNNTTGSGNTAIGFGAGSSITVGNNNIDIANPGYFVDDRVIRIGTPGTHTAFFAAGISGVGLDSQATTLYIDATSQQLCLTNSSRRFKDDIQDMADASSGLLRLRPVKFRYRRPYADGSKPIEYGLIAEEVAGVYPDLVVKGADGQIEAVQYHKLLPMLLNELQKEHTTNQGLQTRLAALQTASDGVDSLRAQISALHKALETLVRCGKGVGETACPSPGQNRTVRK